MSATCRRHDTECRRLGKKTTRRHPTCGAKEFRQQQDRDQHSRTRAALSSERLEFRQQQDRDWHRRATAAESVRITQDVNDSNETFSIDMLGRPTANHLANFEFDEDDVDQAYYYFLFVFYPFHHTSYPLVLNFSIMC